MLFLFLLSKLERLPQVYRYPNTEGDVTPDTWDLQAAGLFKKLPNDGCLVVLAPSGESFLQYPIITGVLGLNMQAKWVVGIGALFVLGSIGLLVQQWFGAPVSTSAGKDEVIAEVIRNWQKAHPADQRFVILPTFTNDAVFDKETGLIWELAPQALAVTWNEARMVCPTRVTGGQKGWRLPAPSEMRSLVGPAVDAPGPNLSPGHPFLNVQPTSYWTVVPEANQPSYAKYLDAFLGNVLSLTRIYTFPVWCVRGPVKMGE